MKKVYGSPNCSACKILCMQLDEAKEEYKYYDVTKMSTEDTKELVERAGTFELPIVEE